MSNERGGPPPDKRPQPGPSPDTTIVQKVLGKTALALESTMTRLRRLQHTEVVRSGRSAPPPPRPAPTPAPPNRAPVTPPPRPPSAASGPRETVPARPAAQPMPSSPARGERGEPPSGRVAHDARGNAIWKWAANALESTSRMLKRLEAPELSIEDKPKSDELQLEERDRGGGYDPYSKGGRGGGAGYDPYSKGTKQKKP